MKKIFILLFSIGLAYGASAQRGAGHGYVGGGFHGAYHGGYHGTYHSNYAPRVYFAPAFYGGWGWGLGLGLGWGYGLGWGVPGWYGPWYYPAAYPPYYYGRGPMPQGLDEEIRGIRSDYKAQIKDIKHDKALSHNDKAQKINQLEQERDAAVTKARHDFYDARMKARFGGRNVQPSSGNGNSQEDMDHPEYSDKDGDTGGQK